MSEFKSEQIKSVIKDLLKKKKLTYEDVAKELECSVPTIKRILGPEELSLPRLLQLCDLLEVNLSDIETIINISKEKKEKFTLEQEEFLVKNPHYLSYLILLYSMTPQEIAEKFNLSERSTDKYLMGLEKQELVKVTGNLRVKPAYKNFPALGAGPLAKAHYQKTIQTGAKFFVEAISEKLMTYDPKTDDRTPQGYSMNLTKASRASYSQFIEEQNKARQAFFKLASYEEKSLPAEELQTAVILQAYAFVPHENTALKLLENTFGEIKNI